MTEVALVVCTIDRPEALDRCLRAVLAGRLLPNSLIVVDQGSGGIAPELAAAFEQRGTSFEHARMLKRGVSRGRNLGILRTHSDLVAFTDDDCVPDGGWLEALVQACAPDIGCVSGRVLPLPSPDADMVPVSCRTRTQPVVYRGLAPHTPWDVGTGGNLLLRRHVLEQVGGFDEDLGPGAPGRAAEDIDLLYRLLHAGLAISYAPEALVLHQMKPRRDHLRTELAYGYGMGAFLGRRIAAGDRNAADLLRRYGRLRTSEMLAAIRHGDRHGLAGTLLNMLGAARGAGWGWMRARTEPVRP